MKCAGEGTAVFFSGGRINFSNSPGGGFVGFAGSGAHPPLNSCQNQSEGYATLKAS